MTNHFVALLFLVWPDTKVHVFVPFKKGKHIFYVIEYIAEGLDVWLTELHQKVKAGSLLKTDWFRRSNCHSACNPVVSSIPWLTLHFHGLLSGFLAPPLNKAVCRAT